MTPRPGRRPRADAGFTLIELLTVMLVIGILAGIALPWYRDAVDRADAASIIADFHAIQLAAYTYFADENGFPPNANAGRVPPALAPYLPENFSFTTERVQYRWRRWARPDTDRWERRTSRNQPVIGVEVRTDDQKLLAAVESIYRGPVALKRHDRLTLVLE